MIRRSLCEFIGTYFLVLLGCGAMVVEARTGALTHAGVAIAWGLVVLTMIYAIGDLSGAHINPAVSIAFASVGRMTFRDAGVYVVAQCSGAIAAAFSLLAVFGLGEHQLGSTMVMLPIRAGWLVEFMMTFMLMFIIMGVSTGAKEKSITAGLAVGATIAMQAMVAGPLTKASMNPARSLGPAIASGYFDSLWLYLTAPLIGAVAGGWCYRMIHGERQTASNELEKGG